MTEQNGRCLLASKSRRYLPLSFLMLGNTVLLRGLILFIFCFIALRLVAQTVVQDSLYDLPEIVVADSLSTPGSSLVTAAIPVEDLKPGQYFSLAEALERNGLLFIKSYGIGSLATANVRGGAASQTTISWNDIPIQSPMLGLLDLSLLPAMQVDEAGIDYAAGIGGDIFFRTHRPDSAVCIVDGLTVGSFGLFRKTVGLSGGHSFAYKLSAQVDKVKNDFPFLIRKNLVRKKMTNAALQQQAFQQSFFFRAHPKHQLELHLWQQATRRELPPTTVETRNEAYQTDDTYRQQLRWRAIGQKAVWETALAYFQEDIFYADPIILLEAPSDFRSWLLQTKRQSTLGQRTKITSAVRLQSTNAIANGYRQRREQRYIRLEQGIRHEWPHALVLDAQAELQLTNDQPEALAGRASIGRSTTGWAWQLGVQRDFRVPTMNDLFWLPGGNPALQPERAWGQSLLLRKRWPETQTSIQIDGFNRLVTNWIQWAQLENQSFWSAQNVTEVWSRGAQVQLEQAVVLEEINLRMTANYQWTRSTFQVPVLNPSIDKGEPLWYSPEHQLNLQLFVRSGRFSGRYIHRYVSSSVGINDNLDAYQVGDVQLDAHLGKEKQTAVFFHLNNLWNTNYRVIERRVMPGRNWSVGYRVDFAL